jgi:predicted O-methyltransferase YrrM
MGYPDNSERTTLSRAAQAARSFVRPFVRQATAAMFARRPLSSWPPILGRIHEIKIPRGIVPHPTPQPIGSANINNLIELIEKTRQVAGDIAECGVYRGRTLIPMAIYVKQQGINKNLYGFDSFEGFAPSVVEDLRLGGTNDEWKVPGNMSGTSLELVSSKAEVFRLSNVTLVKGYFDSTFPAFSNATFSFVHLDCDAYEAYRECLAFFYSRISTGGIISFDEYNDPPWPGCNKAVDEFLSDKPEKLRVIALDNYEKYYFIKQ